MVADAIVDNGYGGMSDAEDARDGSFSSIRHDLKLSLIVCLVFALVPFIWSPLSLLLGNMTIAVFSVIVLPAGMFGFSGLCGLYGTAVSLVRSCKSGSVPSLMRSLLFWGNAVFGACMTSCAVFLFYSLALTV